MGLSVYDYFTKLQHEYVYCKVREQIYPIPQHKEYWKGVAERKKAKIQKIASKNTLESIFDYKEAYEKVFQSLIGYGLPKFYYPDELLESKQRYWDVRNYFCAGSDVKVKGKLSLSPVGEFELDKAAIGKISDSDFDNQVSLVYVNYLDGFHTVSFDNMKRIL